MISGGAKQIDDEEVAAGALCALADYASNRLVITESGGIGPLVRSA